MKAYAMAQHPSFFQRQLFPLNDLSNFYIKAYMAKTFKIFFTWTTGLNALIFGMEHSWGKEIQLCSNEVPRVTNGHSLRGQIFI